MVNVGERDCDSEGVKLDVCEVLRVVVNDTVAHDVEDNDAVRDTVSVGEPDCDTLAQ